jgi:Na+/melibiose symporter-like transporter
VAGGGAEQVYLTFLVGRDGLTDAQTRFAATDSASRLIGPAIAGLLVQLLSGPFAILVNAAGYLLSLWNLSKIGVREPAPAPSKAHPLRDMLDGLRFVWNHPLLRTLAVAAGIWHVLFYAFIALQVLFATRVLGMAPGVLGLTGMMGGIGVLVSSAVLKPLIRRIGTGATIVAGVAATAVAFALMPLVPAALFGSTAATAAAYAVLLFFFDCGAMLFFMPYVALRQRVTPDEFLGRMVSTMRFLTVAIGPVGALAAGATAELFGVRAALGCIGIGALALSAWMAFGTTLRSLRE